MVSQRRRSLRILVSGMIGAVPHQGGATWAVLQYMLGFRRLGHDVYFVEPIRREDIKPAGPLERSPNAAYFRAVMRRFGFSRCAAMLLTGEGATVGMSYAALQSLAPTLDVHVNISGMLTDESICGRVPMRVYLDLDPAFNQLWHAVQGIDMRFAGHTHFVTVGPAIGTPASKIPACGRRWIPTLQPVVLAHWPIARRTRYDGLTTIGNWRGYGSVEYDGEFYGQKAHALREFMALPTMMREKFMIAMAIHPGEHRDLAALNENGWHVIDPASVAATPQSYRQFVRASKAEFGIAKSGYVQSQCGWFSDRSVCYLASGRPVIAHDTGFDKFLPVGAGLFKFSRAGEVMDAVRALDKDYAHHARAARRLAEEHFDSDVVLPSLLSRIGAES